MNENIATTDNTMSSKKINTDSKVIETLPIYSDRIGLILHEELMDHYKRKSTMDQSNNNYNNMNIKPSDIRTVNASIDKGVIGIRGKMIHYSSSENENYENGDDDSSSSDDGTTETEIDSDTNTITNTISSTTALVTKSSTSSCSKQKRILLSSMKKSDSNMKYLPSPPMVTMTIQYNPTSIHDQKTKNANNNDTLDKPLNENDDNYIIGTGISVNNSLNHGTSQYGIRIPLALTPASLQLRPQFYGNSTQQYHEKLSLLQSLHNLSQLLSSSDTEKEQYTSSTIHPSPTKNYTMVLLLQSGRFASAIFHQSTCIYHTTSTRYTVRKGQGKSQSSSDSTKGVKSIGSQLRRNGEIQLRQDVYNTLLEWKQIIQNNCAFFLISISKSLQKGFWDDVTSIFGVCNASDEGSVDGGGSRFYKSSDYVRKIPLDYGKPSFEACCSVYEKMMECNIINQVIVSDEDFVAQSLVDDEQNENSIHKEVESMSLSNAMVKQDEKEIKSKNNVPYTPLHKAAQDGNLDELTKLIQTMIAKPNPTADDINPVDIGAGPKLMTPLHLAASAVIIDDNDNSKQTNVDPSVAAKCVSMLLLYGHANPCITDLHGRPPYYLASQEVIRIAFRKARAELGEDAFDWDRDAKVGPPLSDDDIRQKKEKALEKKKRQRQRQKEKKEMEQKEALIEKEREEKEAEAKRKEEEARRVRAGLDAKVKGDNVCDFCQTVCKGKRRSQMFSRLNFIYCSTDCVKKHQRELAAAAATARLNG